MGFFGKSKEEELKSAEMERLQKEEERKENIKKAYREYVENISKISGSVVKIKGAKFVENVSYKFFYVDENFAFVRNITDGGCFFDEERCEKILAEGTIVLEHDEYVCKLCKPIDKQEDRGYFNKAIGEIRNRILPIEILFENTNDNQKNFIMYVENTSKSIRAMFPFFKKLGIKNYYNIIDIPVESFSVNVENGAGFFIKSGYQVLREGNALIFTRASVNEVCIARLHIDEILYYKSEGALRYEQQISGGGGMGINYGGAIVGGLLFGDAGATIGSRMNEEIQKIESKTITHDTRIVTLVVKRDNIIYQIGFNINAEVAFDWLIPEKQYDYVIQKRREMYEKN